MEAIDKITMKTEIPKEIMRRAIHALRERDLKEYELAEPFLLQMTQLKTVGEMFRLFDDIVRKEQDYDTISAMTTAPLTIIEELIHFHFGTRQAGDMEKHVDAQVLAEHDRNRSIDMDAFGLSDPGRGKILDMIEAERKRRRERGDGSDLNGGNKER